MRVRSWAAAAGFAATLAACGGGEVVAVLSFLGSAGGDWRVDGDPDPAVFSDADGCGADPCAVNIAVDGVRDLYGSEFRVVYSGNLSTGYGTCPAASTAGGVVSGRRIVLPNCFEGEYRSINEVLSDDGRIRAYFDSESIDLTTGVWVEIQDGQRRFKFTRDATARAVNLIEGCELTAPTPTPVNATIDMADIDAGRLGTKITAFTVGSETWTGEFIGVSGIRLWRGAGFMDLQRRDEAGSCP